jgi:hypothetical protein
VNGGTLRQMGVIAGGIVLAVLALAVVGRVLR